MDFEALPAEEGGAAHPLEAAVVGAYLPAVPRGPLALTPRPHVNSPRETVQSPRSLTSSLVGGGTLIQAGRGM